MTDIIIVMVTNRPKLPVKIVCNAKPISKQIIIFVIICKRMWLIILYTRLIPLLEIFLDSFKEHKRNASSGGLISNHKKHYIHTESQASPNQK